MSCRRKSVEMELPAVVHRDPHISRVVHISGNDYI